jgi:hypothetical protein
VNENNRVAVHEELFQKWNASHPLQLFRRVGVVTAWLKGADFLEQNLSNGKLSPAPWPESWKSFQRHFEERERGPFLAGSGVLFEIPVFGGFPDDFGRPLETEWVVFELDTNYLQQVWFPKLARMHFDIPGYLNAIEIRVAVPPRTTIYQSSAQLDRSELPVVARLNHCGRSLDSTRGPGVDCQWLLEVYPQPGALEKLVARSRRKNFAVAVFLNGLILVAGLALVRQTRKSRQLAEQQMNFVAGVSHELRTPLTVIRGAAHNLQRGVVTERSQIEQYSGLIIQHSEQLGEMVEQVFALAYASTFHDIATGNNISGASPNGFYAVTGYDLCTGLGTPSGGNLIAALAGLNAQTVSTVASISASALDKNTGAFNFVWPSSIGVTYQIQYKTNLLQANWSNLGAPIPGTGLSVNFSDTNATASDPQRFYRLVISSGR